MRLFFAIDTPALPPWEAARGANPDDRAPAHLTLRFLGETDAARVPELEQAGRDAVAGFAPFEIELDRIGAFPSERDPKIVWVGVERGAPELGLLYRRLEEALEAVGVPHEPRPFVAHVTWRRVRSSRDRELARGHLEGERLPLALRGRVDALLLKESELARDGAVHRTVREFRLEG